MPRKAQKPHILLFGSDGACLSRCALADFPLPEQTVLSLSLRYFNDPEPCHIHRAAVLVRAMEELLRDFGDGARHPLHALDAEKRGYFDQGRVAAFAFERAVAP